MYHPLVHLLDLCTLSYQLHAQTLIWPVDPYYEQWSGDKARRKLFMDKVHEVATRHCPSTHGPGQTVGWGKNDDLDPILTDYSQIDHRRTGITRQNREKEGWILYDTPQEITGRIKDVYLVAYQSRPDPGLVPGVPQITPMPLLTDATKHDSLYCFEGATGTVKFSGASWSIMGFVLAREDKTAPGPPHPYDVYIAFRGSRSGDPRWRRAVTKEKGNPDWVTDMDFGAGLGAQESIPDISQVGNVGRGFAQSMRLTIPNVMTCLEDIQTKKGRAPRMIHVTGHSLGAALAVHFVSAVRLGLYRPDEPRTPKMPATIRHWPWSALQLVPFALPVVGGKSFHQAFNITVASRRVYLTGDIVPQTIRRYAVGQEYEIVPESPTNVKKRGLAIDTLRHEPYLIREYLIKDLQRRQLLGKTLDDPLTKKPWTASLTLKLLLQERRVDNEQVSNVVGANFNVRLTQFLDVLTDFVPTVKRDKVRGLRDAIVVMTQGSYQAFADVTVPNYVNPNQPIRKTIKQVYDDAKGIYDDWNDFIGSCIFLSAASKGTVQRARAEVAKDPFDSLKMK